MKENILHISTLHSANSARIFHKYVKLSTELGISDAYLCGQITNSEDQIHRISAYKTTGVRRLYAIFLIPFLVKKFNHNWVQIHDPELLLCLPLIKLVTKKKIIYDLHEDFPVQYAANHKKSKAFEYFLKSIEVFFIRYFVDLLVCATPFIFKKYSVYKKALMIENNPIDIPKNIFETTKRDIDIIYAGLLSPNRGIVEFLDQLDQLDASLKIVFAGPYSSQQYQAKVEKHRNFSKIEYLGYLPKTEITALYERSKVGLILLKQSANYEVARPTKLFEYASFGMKILCTKTKFLSKELNGKSFVHFLDADNADLKLLENFVRSKIKTIEIEEILSYLNTIDSFRSQFKNMIEEL